MLKPKPNYRANVGTFFEKAKFNFKKKCTKRSLLFFSSKPRFQKSMKKTKKNALFS